MKKGKNVLIIGAGLSGLSVAVHLIRKNCAVTVIDNEINHSSAIAAGMINPLVFRRMTKSWRVDEFMPFLKSFYQSLEKETKCSFLHPITIRRMFSTQQERELWLDRQETNEYSNFMHVLSSEDDLYSEAINNFGSGRVKNSSYVDTKIFLESLKKYVGEKGKLISKEFSYSNLDELKYNDDKYDEIVFCEGYLGVDNPWFGDLPLDQTKGETLTITSSEIPENESLNRKCFVLPLGNNTFKVGSTYVWNTPDTNPTEAGKATILENLSYLTKAKFSVTDQGAGVRPTTKDRRPLIGTHLTHSNYHIFNGLGAKGYMIAPFLSAAFVDYLIEGKDLDAEIDIKRIYNKRYS